MTFTWLGGAGYLLRLGPFRIIGDPVAAASIELDGSGAVRDAPAPPADLSGLDAVCLTCTRTDHYDPELVGGIEAVPVLTPAGAEVPGGRGVEWFEGITLEKEGERLTITAVQAQSLADGADEP